MILPHGFTLVLAGSMATAIGDRGYPGWAGIWLLICGANGAFMLTGLLLCALRLDPRTQMVALPTFNFTPLVTLPAVHVLITRIPDRRLAFLCAGAATVWIYLLLVTVLVTAYLSSVERRTSRCGGTR